MAIKKLATVQEFVLPETIDGAPEQERGRYRVRMATTGLRRQLSTAVSEEGWGSFATYQMRQAYYTFAGSSIRWEDNTPVFPDPIELTGIVRKNEEIEHLRMWSKAWDELPTDVADWIMECVYEVNVDWDPNRLNPM